MAPDLGLGPPQAPPPPGGPQGGQGPTGSQLQKSWICAPGIPEWKHLVSLLTWPHAGPCRLQPPPPPPPSRGKGSTGSQLQKSWTCAPGIPEWKHLTTVLTWPHARPCRLELLSWSWLTPTWALVESRGLHTKSGAPITTEWPCLAS